MNGNSSGLQAADAQLGARVRALSTNIFVQLSMLALITLLRNTLELLGPLTGSRNFCCFHANYSSFLNTFTYELLLIYGGIFLVHLLLGGDRQQLQRLVVAAILFMLPLFVFVPLVNLGLNYHGPELPIWLLPGLYLPMGSVVGFALILGLLPPLIRRIYPNRSWLRIFFALGVGFSTMFGWTYYVGLVLAYGQDQLWLAARDANRMDIYSLTFVAPLVVAFPLYIRSNYDVGKRKAAWAAFGFIVATNSLLVLTSGLFSKPVRLGRPLVCQQIVLPITDSQRTARLAQAVALQVAQRPSDFELLKKRHSYPQRVGQRHRIAYLHPPAKRDPLFVAAQRLQNGATSKAIRTPKSWRVLKRIPAPTTTPVEHILVSFTSAKNKMPGFEAAGARALWLVRRARASPAAAFGQLAKEHSDGPFALHGGRVPAWPTGSLPHFDRVLLELEPGQVSDVVPSPLGFHIFRRLP